MPGTEIELYDEDLPGASVEAPQQVPPQGTPLASEITRVQGELYQLRDEAAELVQGGTDGAPGTGLVPAQQSPVQVKRRLARTRSQLVHKQAAIAAKAAEMKALLDAQRQELDEVMRPMQALVARIEEAIWTVNLYLGREEEIVVLRRGDPAPATEVLHVRQLVLAMDEETALHPEDEGIDYHDLAEFDAWLLASPAHLDQVLPERKGVVALVPRYRSRQDDRSSAAAEANAQTYWLLRNGDNLYRMATDFQVGSHLVPLADEFTGYFHTERRDYSSGGSGKVHRIPITPGTRAWEQAEERADARQRHYMRVALVLQGLLDRTTVFHPLPAGGIDMLRTWAHEHQQVRFIYDADPSLGTGREPFGAWLARLNTQLRPGMRVVGNYDHWDFTQHSTGEYRHTGGNSRLRPHTASTPRTGELYQLEGRDGRYLYFRYQRSDTVYSRSDWQGHVPTRRATCLVDPQADKWVLPYDLVTEAECLAYLEARTERHAYVDMFPVLRAAIAAKRAEAAEEAPFRTMLAGVLARDNGVAVEQAVVAVPGLVDWWKLTLRNHRPLVGDEASQAKAVQAIVAEHARQLRQEGQAVDHALVAELRAAHPDAMLVAMRRDGLYAVYVPANDGSVWVHRYVYRRRGKLYSSRQWVLFPKAQLAPLQVLYRTDRLATWNHDAALGEHLADPERDRIGATLAHSGAQVEAVAYDPQRRQFYVWYYEADAVVDEAHPLLGRHEPPQAREVRKAWRRTTGGRVALHDPEWGTGGRPNWAGQVRPWIVPQNVHSRGQHYDVLYVDEALVARWDREQARYKAVAARHMELWQQVRDHMDGLEAAWLRRAEAVAYAKFLDDYDDPELWPGHLKLIQRDLRYPHTHHRSGTFGEADQLYRAVQWLVEGGAQVAGLTAAQVVAAAQACGLVYRPDSWDKLPAPVPDDVADLVFPPLAAAQGEVDDGEDDDGWQDV